MVLIKKMKIFHLFHFSKIGQENVFDDTLERKQAYLYYKNKKPNKSKYWDFSKGKFSMFLFLSIIGQENVLNDILKIKNAFLDYKARSSKRGLTMVLDNSFFIVFFLEYCQTHFLGIFSHKKYSKYSILRLKPRTNPFGKIPIFQILELPFLYSLESICFFF